MKTSGKLVILSLLVLIVLVLAACAGASTSEEPTQTPVFVVVDDDDDEDADDEEAPEPTATPISAEDGEAEEDVDLPVIGEDGVPDNIDCNAGIVEQTFENGRMFWVGRTLNERCSEEHEYLPGTGEVWVVIFDEDIDADVQVNERDVAGEWFSFVDEWDEATDPVDYSEDVDVPSGLQVPVRGFGLVWSEMLTDEQREALGFATQDEVGYSTDYEYEFDGFLDDDGEYVERPGVHKIETIVDEAFYLDEASPYFSYAEED